MTARTKHTEVFYLDAFEIESDEWVDDNGHKLAVGWYFQIGNLIGPFDTRTDALEAAGL